jgi:hypothetical protein
MPRRRTPPSLSPGSRPGPLLRVLRPLEDGQSGIHQPGTILRCDQVRRESLLPLLDAGVLMFFIDPAALAALSEE